MVMRVGVLVVMMSCLCVNTGCEMNDETVQGICTFNRVPWSEGRDGNVIDDQDDGGRMQGREELHSARLQQRLSCPPRLQQAGSGILKLQIRLRILHPCLLG